MAAHAGALAPPLLRLPPRPLLCPRFHNRNTTPSSHLPRALRLAVVRAASGDDGGNGGPLAEGHETEQQGPQSLPAEGREQEPRAPPSFPALSEIRWRELLSPEPSNAVAVVLSGAIAWAGGSLLLQLTLIFLSIFAAAIKYSFIAAILLYLLIALL